MTTILNKNNSDIEFNAVLDTYLASLNSEIPGDFEEHKDYVRAYWGLGEMPIETEMESKTTILNRVRVFFGI